MGKQINKSSFALKWDKDEERYYETGVSRGVLYVYDPEAEGATPEGDATGAVGYCPGVVWNGLTQVQETPSGAEANAQYADDIKYLNLYSLEELGATVEAFTYPDEFMACDGSAEVGNGVYAGQQARKKFAMCYTTRIGSEAEEELGYKLHILYGCKASPSERAYATVNDSPEPITFSWELTTSPVPVVVAGKSYKDTALITVDSRRTDSTKLDALESVLFGTPAVTGDNPVPEVPAKLLTPAAIIAAVAQG